MSPANAEDKVCVGVQMESEPSKYFYLEVVENAGRGIMLCRRFFLRLCGSPLATLPFLRRFDLPLDVADEPVSLLLLLEPDAALLTSDLDEESTGLSIFDGICVPNARFVPLILLRFLLFLLA